MKRKKLFLFVLAHLSLSVAASSTARTGATACSSSLDTPFVTPYLEGHRPVERGCITSERTKGGDSEGRALHLVRINTRAKIVWLTVTENHSSLTSTGVVLVLESPTPITWHLTFAGASPTPPDRRFVFLSKGSKALDQRAKGSITWSSLEEALGTESTDPLSDEQLVDIVRQKWGAVTTMTRTNGANRISILVPDDATSTHCRITEFNSDAVNAYLFSKRTARGCFYPERAGSGAFDVIILDLDSADGMPSAPGLEPAPVYLTLRPAKDYSSATRDVLLILRSKETVHWMLQSSNLLRGDLMVVTDSKGLVNDLGLSRGHKLSIRRTERGSLLPDNFDELWNLTTAYDLSDAEPLAYVKLDKSNIISILVPKKGETRGFEIKEESNITMVEAENVLMIPESVLEEALSHEEATMALTELTGSVKRAMKKQCSQSETVVTVPKAAAEPHEVSSVTLSDPTCKASENTTHWILKSPSTSCGSLNMFSGKNPMFRNKVVLNLASGSISARISFSCRFKPGLPGQEESLEEENQAYNTIVVSPDHGSRDDDQEMYVMRVLDSATGQVLLERRGDAANAVPGQRVSVHTRFDTRSSLSLAIETCWLSPSESQHAIDDVNNKDELVHNGCPEASINVTMSDASSFEFTVPQRNRDIGKMYLYCLIGLCKSFKGEKGSMANVKSCEDPTVSCSSLSARRLHRSPVAMQLTRRGPLFVHPKLHLQAEKARVALKNVGKIVKPNSSVESPGLHSSHVVMVGVPAEMAVVIALASFVIGATLTGMLCCVHHRKVAPKMQQPRHRANEFVADGSELQSMIGNGHVVNNNATCC